MELILSTYKDYRIWFLEHLIELKLNWNIDQIESHFQTNQGDNSFYLIQDKLVGFLLVKKIELVDEIEIEIIHLEVIKAFQNLGIGTKLIKNLEKKYENIEKNVQIFLETNKNNKIAINLYEKMGYKTYNERKNYYMQGKIDNIHSNTALLFTKKLKSI